MQLQSMPSLYYPALAHFSHSRTTESVQIPRRSVGGKYGSMYVIVHGMCRRNKKLKRNCDSTKHQADMQFRLKYAPTDRTFLSFRIRLNIYYGITPYLLVQFLPFSYQALLTILSAGIDCYPRGTLLLQVDSVIKDPTVDMRCPSSSCRLAFVSLLRVEKCIANLIRIKLPSAFYSQIILPCRY